MHFFNTIFDKIFLLNLKRRSDRLSRMNKLLNNLNLKYNLIYAYDGKEMGIEPKKAHLMSFSKILDIAIKENLKNFLFLEDDIIIQKELHKNHDKIIYDLKHINWDIVSFGGTWNYPYDKNLHPQKIGQISYNINESYEAHCVGINNQCFFKIKEIISKHNFLLDEIFEKESKNFKRIMIWDNWLKAKPKDKFIRWGWVNQIKSDTDLCGKIENEFKRKYWNN